LPDATLRSHRLTRAGPRTKLARVPVLVARLNVPAAPISSPALQRRAQRMLAALRLARAELSLVLCDDPAIHALNRRHRRKDKPTDVLAFAMREGAPMPRAGALLGDVVISLDAARRQAREHEHSLWTEVTLLLAHGLLHLVGYDHRTDEEEAEMNRQAARLVQATRRRAPRVTPKSVDNGRRRIANSPR
jgi:probable rRNA maturation factor